MLIGIDASRAATSRRTGTEGYAWHLIQSLLPLADERGHSVRLYYNQPPQHPISDTAHHTVVIPAPRLWTHVRLAAELHRRPPDVFFTPAHVIPLTWKGVSVATIHDLGYHHFPEAHTRRRVRELTWSTRHNARRARRVIADSQATQRDLVDFYQTDLGKITVVYPGYDSDLQPIVDEAVMTRAGTQYGITNPYFLFLGTLQPRKNIGRILDAFLDVAAEIPQQLVLAGKPGWLAQPFLDRIAALPEHLRQRIHLTGFVAEADKAALLSGATALIFPSLYEGFGFPVLEAQACGTPVLASNNSSLPEVAGDGGVLVSAESSAEIADAMRNLALDDALRKRLVSAGFANVKRFSWQTAAQEVLMVLEEAASG